jgi:hypothetical protein
MANQADSSFAGHHRLCVCVGGGGGRASVNLPPENLELPLIYLLSNTQAESHFTVE